METISHLPIDEQVALYHQFDGLVLKQEAFEKPKDTPPNRSEY